MRGDGNTIINSQPLTTPAFVVGQTGREEKENHHDIHCPNKCRGPIDRRSLVRVRGHKLSPTPTAIPRNQVLKSSLDQLLALSPSSQSKRPSLSPPSPPPPLHLTEMPSVEKAPSTLYDKIYADHLIEGQTIYIDRYVSWLAIFYIFHSFSLFF